MAGIDTVMSINRLIEKFALANAFQHGGKAQAGAITGKLMAEQPNLKNKLKDLAPKIQKIVSEVNRLKATEQEERLRKLWPDFFKPKEAEKKHLKDLPNAVEEKVVMRFEPSFSGRLHIGHAYPLSLNYSYVKKYKGKMILRLADTNPRNADVAAYRGIPEDAKWLTSNGIDQVIIQSSRMRLYYKHIEEFIERGFAYVCSCNLEAWKKLTLAKRACPCRSLSQEENLIRWKKMQSKNGYKEGEAVLRIKTDINHPNPALRDWPAARIVTESPHPKQGKKYRVWPLMNLAVVVDDHELGVTHAIRAKEHMDNEKRQLYIYKYMGWKAPTQLYVGRIKFEDMELSKSKIRLLIESGKYTGWDDIRLSTLVALKRRGYQPQAIVDLYTQMGVSEADKKVSSSDFFKLLNAIDGKILDPVARRYSFVAEPVEVEVRNAPKIDEVEINLHPNRECGKKMVKVGNKFYISKKDLGKFRGKEIRLMHMYNIRLNKTVQFTSKENKDIPRINWVPTNFAVKAEILMPDGKIARGFAEKNVKKLKVGDVIQFERVGFARLDKKEKDKIIFAFAHN